MQIFHGRMSIYTKVTGALKVGQGQQAPLYTQRICRGQLLCDV